MSKVTKGWPLKRRREQAQRIRKQKPWKKATGPKTEEGKAASKNNGYKHGWRSEDMREVYRLLRVMRLMAKEIEARHCGDRLPRDDDRGETHDSP